MYEFKIVAQDVDSELDSGFNIEFDRSYDVRFEKLPITNQAAQEAIQQGYNWFPTTDMIMDFGENEVVGYAYFDEDTGEYVDSQLVK